MALNQFSFTKPNDPATARFSRDRKLAEMLAQQSLAPEQTQMAGGYAVRQTALNPLAKIAQALASRKMAERADTGEQDYMRQQGEDRARLIAEAMRAGQGQEARPAIEAPPEDLGGGPGRPDMPSQGPDPARTYMMLAGSNDPALQQAGLSGFTESLKPKVLGRTMVDGSGRTIAVDSTWQAEQEANRVAREQQMEAQRLQRQQEIEMRLQDARLSREDRASLQRELQQNQIQARQDMMRLAASMRPEQAPSPVTVADPNDPTKSIVIDAKTNRTIGNSPPKPVQEKALPNAAITNLVDAGGLAEGTSRSLSTFKPEFAGKTILGETSNVVGRVFGDNSGQAQWWQDYASQNNVKRNKLFGSALTATEKAEWEKTIATPRMNSGEVEKNLRRQAELEAKAARKLATPYLAAGYSRAQIEGALGIPLDELNGASGQWDGQDRRKPTPGQPAVIELDRNGNPVKR